MKRFSLTRLMANQMFIGHRLALKDKYLQMRMQMMIHIAKNVSNATPQNINILEPHSWFYQDGVEYEPINENWKHAIKNNGYHLDIWHSTIVLDRLYIVKGSLLFELQYPHNILHQMSHDPARVKIRRIIELITEKYDEMNGTFFTEDEHNLSLPDV